MNLVIWYPNPATSKCMVHDKATGMFLRKDGTWTEDAKKARVFDCKRDASYAKEEKERQQAEFMNERLV